MNLRRKPTEREMRAKGYLPARFTGAWHRHVRHCRNAGKYLSMVILAKPLTGGWRVWRVGKATVETYHPSFIRLTRTKTNLN